MKPKIEMGYYLYEIQGTDRPKRFMGRGSFAFTFTKEYDSVYNIYKRSKTLTLWANPKTGELTEDIPHEAIEWLEAKKQALKYAEKNGYSYAWPLS